MEDIQQKFSSHKAHFVRWGIVVLVMLSLFLLVQTWSTWKESRFIGVGIGAQNTITATGEGEVFAVPDVAEFTVGVTKKAVTVVEAQRAMTDVMNNAVEYLKDYGVDKDDIRTTWFNVQPEYSYQRDTVMCITLPCPPPPAERVLSGFSVSQNITAKVREIDDAGSILGGLAEIGVTDVTGPNFTIDKPEALEREARQMAIEDAKEKARDLARDLGVSLVRIVAYNEGGNTPIQYRAMSTDFALDEAMGAPAPQLPPGQNQITSRVSITYEIR